MMDGNHFHKHSELCDHDPFHLAVQQEDNELLLRYTGQPNSEKKQIGD